MNIKCKNCKGENPLGTIFCRLCGAKLDMEGLDKDIKGYLKGRKIFHIFSGFFRITLIIFLLVSIYGAYLIFEPINYFRPVFVLPKSQESSTMDLYNKVDIGIPGTYKFTDEQLTYLAAKIFLKKENVIKISFPENKYFGFTITKNMIDYYVKLNIRITAVCELVIEQNKTGKNFLNAKFKYFKLGELKLPEYYNQLIIEDFKTYLTNRKLESFLKKIDKVKIHNNQATIILSD